VYLSVFEVYLKCISVRAQDDCIENCILCIYNVFRPTHYIMCRYIQNTSNTMYLDSFTRQWSRDGVCLPQLLLGPGHIPQGVLGVVLGAPKATYG
jgi:hypothetical protein